MIHLAACRILVTPSLVQTWLPNGALIEGAPHDTPEYAETARAHGYDADVARMNRCHELTHSLLTHWLGLPASPVFLRLARGVDEADELTRAEEGACLALETYANRLGVDLERVAGRWGSNERHTDRHRRPRADRLPR